MREHGKTEHEIDRHLRRNKKKEMQVHSMTHSITIIYLNDGKICENERNKDTGNEAGREIRRERVF